MRLCSHVVTNDTGLAPNPFHGSCTTALCTPSHMRLKLKKDDWIIGHGTKASGHNLIYAMKVSQRISMETYYSAKEFQDKKPDPTGSLDRQCGDNLYFRLNGAWKRLPSHFHNARKNFEADVGRDRRGRPVFIAEHFFYFGAKPVPIPTQHQEILCLRQGAPDAAQSAALKFVDWLEATYKPGRHANPMNFDDHRDDPSPFITEL